MQMTKEVISRSTSAWPIQEMPQRSLCSVTAWRRVIQMPPTHFGTTILTCYRNLVALSCTLTLPRFTVRSRQVLTTGRHTSRPKIGSRSRRTVALPPWCLQTGALALLLASTYAPRARTEHLQRPIVVDTEPFNRAGVNEVEDLLPVTLARRLPICWRCGHAFYSYSQNFDLWLLTSGKASSLTWVKTPKPT